MRLVDSEINTTYSKWRLISTGEAVSSKAERVNENGGNVWFGF